MAWLTANGYAPQYRKLQPTEPDQIAGTPTNFPLALVIAGDADLAAHARADAHDIAITLADGVTELDYERVSWDSGTGALEIWLKDPAPEDEDEYYIYYGDEDQVADRQSATAVWDANFKGVWHLGEASATTTVVDSTGVNDGTKKGSGEPAQGAGKVSYGQDFDGDDDYIQCGTNASINPTSYITVETWFKTNELESQDMVSKYQRTDDQRAYSLWLAGGGLLRVIWRTSVDGLNVKDCQSDAQYPTDGTFWYAVGTMDGTNAKLYINANVQADTETQTGINTSNEELEFGHSDTYGQFFNGVIDEVRISSIARDVNWIITSHNNQKSAAPGGTFWSALGSEESLLVTPPSYSFIM